MANSLYSLATIRYWLVPDGAIAQLGERLLCKQDVVGSIPSGSTILTEQRRIQRASLAARAPYVVGAVLPDLSTS